MKKLLFLCLTALTLQAPCFAYDAKVDGIYYNITSSSTVEVTYATSTNKNGEYYNGNITIPSSITLSNKVYTVTAIGKSAFHSCYVLGGGIKAFVL